MEIVEIKPGVFAVDRPESASNLAYLKTNEGIVLIDTTSSTKEMQAVLDRAQISPDEVSLILITHGDHDHTGGSTLFNCPLLAHHITTLRMPRKIKKKLPIETFKGKHHRIEHGGVSIEMIFTGGHKPDHCMVWLPEQKALFTGDLIFQGRYPFMVNSHVPTWIEKLEELAGYGAEVILPGHGTFCDQEDIEQQVGYLQATWDRVSECIQAGYSLSNTMRDKNMPRPEGWGKEQLFEKNIKIIYNQVKDSI